MLAEEDAPTGGGPQLVGVLLGCGWRVRVGVGGIGVEVAPTVAVAPLVVIGVAVGVLALLLSGDAPDRVAVLLLLAKVSPVEFEEFRLLESPLEPEPALAASVYVNPPEPVVTKPQSQLVLARTAPFTRYSSKSARDQAIVNLMPWF